MRELDGSWDASRLRAAVARRGVKIAWLAEQLDVNRNTMTNYLRGRRVPDAVALKRAAVALRVTADYLLRLSDEGDNAE